MDTKTQLSRGENMLSEEKVQECGTERARMVEKLRGEDGEQIEKQLECLFTASEGDEDDIFITQKDRVDSEESVK